MGKIALVNINFIDIENGIGYLNHTIEIDSERIVSIYDSKQRKPDSSFVCYDYSDCWAMPGMVDMHTHITMSPLLGEPPYYMHPEKILEASHANLIELRRIGVTMCRDMGSYQYSTEWVKQSLKNEANLPEIFSCGSVITYPLGHMCEYGFEIEDIKDIRRAISRNKNPGADFIKIASDPKDAEAANRIPNPAFEFNAINSIVDVSNKNNMLVACHTYPSLEGVRRALRGKVRTIEHAVPLNAAMEKQYYPETFYVPTFSTALDVCNISCLDNLKIVKNHNLLEYVKNSMPSSCPYDGSIPESIEEWLHILLDMLPLAIVSDQLLCTGSDAGCKGTDFQTLLREIMLMCAGCNK